MQDIILGIDLGTTNSLAGAIVNGAPVLFGDSSGNELLPSVVGVNAAGEIIVGRAAKNRRVLDPEGTVVSVKRLMGSSTGRRVGQRELHQRRFLPSSWAPWSTGPKPSWGSVRRAR